MEIINPNVETMTKLCPSCYREQSILEFTKIERGKVRECKLCRTCRNRIAREEYKKKGRTDRTSSNLLQLRDVVLDKNLLTLCLGLYNNYGVDLQIKQPLNMSKELEDVVRQLLCKRVSKKGEKRIKLAKIKNGNLVFNLYSNDIYLRSKNLGMYILLYALGDDSK